MKALMADHIICGILAHFSLNNSKAPVQTSESFIFGNSKRVAIKSAQKASLASRGRRVGKWSIAMTSIPVRPSSLLSLSASTSQRKPYTRYESMDHQMWSIHNTGEDCLGWWNRN